MKLLLDTCTFLWINTNASELSKTARKLFASPNNMAYLSAVSSWEIMIKHRLGKLPLPDTPAKFVRDGRILHHIEALPLTEAATWHLDKLSNLHRDPFDRILVCQALEHGMTLLTPDPLIRQYSVETIW
ncbi:MAG: type II toxin-antitoxin system VapC family toxin [Gammaproteobacteria bacterium]|nr:type II toxin-antitoxin system VapC family toxin [Gammaproteobacteria bacterium]